MRKNSHHTEEAKRKNAEAHLGKKHTAETRALISRVTRGRSHGPLAEETKAKISASLTGKTLSDETRARMRAAWERRKQEGRLPTEETKSKMRTAQLGKTHTAAARSKMSAAKKGKPGRKLTDAEKLALSIKARNQVCSPETREKMRLARKGTSVQHARREWYRGIAFHSTWEVRYAKALDALGIRWDYEPKRFDLGDCTYLPDFYLPDFDAWHEVKGWMDYNSTKRIERFSKLFRHLELVLIMKAELEEAERCAAIPTP